MNTPDRFDFSIKLDKVIIKAKANKCFMSIVRVFFYTSYEASQEVGISYEDTKWGSFWGQSGHGQDQGHGQKPCHWVAYIIAKMVSLKPWFCGITKFRLLLVQCGIK